MPLSPPIWERGDRTFWEVVADAEALIDFLRDDELTSIWAHWDACRRHVEDVAEGEVGEVAADFERASTEENQAWNGVQATIDDYIERRYPLE